MPEPLTLLVLVLALAAGLVAAIVVAQHVQTGQAEFHRYLLTHILLFNLLILAGLVFRVIQPQMPIGPTAVPFLLALMAALKLAWLVSFALMIRLLSGRPVSGRMTGRAARRGLVLFAFWAVIALSAWFAALPGLFNAVVWLLEAVVLGGAMVATAWLAKDTRRIPRGSRRRATAVFAVFHFVLLLLVSAALLLSALRPGPQENGLVLVNGAFLLLFNLFPPLWIRHYRPAPAETASDRFETYGVTPREQQVILLIQAGKTNQEIADELFISVATVKDHNNNLFRKCSVRNRVELANLFR